MCLPLLPTSSVFCVRASWGQTPQAVEVGGSVATGDGVKQRDMPSNTVPCRILLVHDTVASSFKVTSVCFKSNFFTIHS